MAETRRGWGEACYVAATFPKAGVPPRGDLASECLNNRALRTKVKEQALIDQHVSWKEAKRIENTIHSCPELESGEQKPSLLVMRSKLREREYSREKGSFKLRTFSLL